MLEVKTIADYDLRHQQNVRKSNPAMYKNHDNPNQEEFGLSVQV